MKDTRRQSAKWFKNMFWELLLVNNSDATFFSFALCDQLNFMVVKPSCQLLPLYYIRWKLHTVSFSTDYQAGKLCQFLKSFVEPMWNHAPLDYLLSYVDHSFFIGKPENADSSNQRDFFLHGSHVPGICRIKSVEYAWSQKTLSTRVNFFSSMLFSFFGASVFSLLNKESMIVRWCFSKPLKKETQSYTVVKTE